MGERTHGRVNSAAVTGINAAAVEVEIDLTTGGLARTVIVGLPDSAVREGRDRVSAALRSCGFAWPPRGQLTLNLAPASLRKVGPVYDLPIAVAVLTATGQLPAEQLEGSCFLGELALDGRLRPVRGVLAMAEHCRLRGHRRIVVPRANGREAGLVKGLEVAAAGHLGDVIRLLAGELDELPPPPPVEPSPPDSADLADVVGQPQAKIALQIAAAGGHNLLMSGPPGVGKSMLASRLPGILEPLDERQALETTRVHSVAGLLDPRRGLIRQPPFRAPHHTISEPGLVGGGQPLRPGEVSLAHHGVLFLDEAPEFRRTTLEALRQPLERGQVEIVRVGGRMVYPSRFQLILAMNPCPCGYHGCEGGSTPACRCAMPAVDRYQQRLSGPLLDRIDLQVALAPIPPEQLGVGSDPEGSSAVLRAGVRAARERQRARYGPGWSNASAPDRLLRERCQLTDAGRTCLEASVQRWRLSGRGFFRVLRVARTIADLDDAEAIVPDHVLQALMLRCRVGTPTAARGRR